MENTSEHYKNNCRCCLEDLHGNVARKLTKTVEKRFLELTSIQVRLKLPCDPDRSQPLQLIILVALVIAQTFV